ncbi:MAG: hypothetical protein IK073_01315 [Paludibacteraceae bacterium]|nr:hypothetical protein [Paludibacteraceae bacterium]
MAKISYEPGIDLTHGALDSEHKLITRQKHLHDTNGTLSKECAVEMYLQRRKRDYLQTPPQGNELAHLQHFGEAAKRTTALIYAYKFPDTASDEQRALLENFRRRFESQLKGNPDPQAPLDKTGKPKQYFRFDNFIRAMIYQELKNA